MIDYVGRKVVLALLQGMLDGIDIKQPKNVEQETIINLTKAPIIGVMKFVTEMPGLTLQFPDSKDLISRNFLKPQEEKMAELQELMCDKYCMYSRSTLLDQEELDEHCDSCEMIKLWNFINNKMEEE